MLHRPKNWAFFASQDYVVGVGPPPPLVGGGRYVVLLAEAAGRVAGALKAPAGAVPALGSA